MHILFGILADVQGNERAAVLPHSRCCDGKAITPRREVAEHVAPIAARRGPKRESLVLIREDSLRVRHGSTGWIEDQTRKRSGVDLSVKAHSCHKEQGRNAK